MRIGDQSRRRRFRLNQGDTRVQPKWYAFFRTARLARRHGWTCSDSVLSASIATQAAVTEGTPDRIPEYAETGRRRCPRASRSRSSELKVSQ